MATSECRRPMDAMRTTTAPARIMEMEMDLGGAR